MLVTVGFYISDWSVFHFGGLTVVFTTIGQPLPIYIIAMSLETRSCVVNDGGRVLNGAIMSDRVCPKT